MSKKGENIYKEKMEGGKPGISKAALRKVKPYTDTVTGKRTGKQK